MEECKHLMEDMLTKNNTILFTKINDLEKRVAVLESRLSKCGCEISAEPDVLEDKEEGTRGIDSSTNLNPFLIPLVVQNVLKHVDSTELTKCRFVCKLWAYIGMEQVVCRNTLLINYNNFSRISELSSLVATTFHGVTRFYVDFEPSFTKAVPQGHIFHLYQILPSFIGRLTYLKIGFTHEFTVYDFWDRFLVNLENIQTLVLDSIPKQFLNVPTIFPTGSDVKILTKLKRIEIVRGYTNGRWRQIGLMADLLRMAPNLKSLKIEGDIEADYNVSMSLSTCVIRALCEVKPEHLSTLSICTSLTENAATLLLQSNLPLTKLFLLNFRLFKLEFRTDSEPRVEALAMSYAERRAEVITYKLRKVLEDEFKVASFNASTKKVSCVQFLQTFQSTLDSLLLARP